MIHSNMCLADQPKQFKAFLLSKKKVQSFPWSCIYYASHGINTCGANDCVFEDSKYLFEIVHALKQLLNVRRQKRAEVPM